MYQQLLERVKSLVSDQLVNRVKSLLWRAGMMALAVFVAFVAENIGSLELSPTATAVLGLILGEVSKWLNTPKPTPIE